MSERGQLRKQAEKAHRDVDSWPRWMKQAADAPPARYSVFPNSAGGWEVKREGAARSISTYSTQVDAQRAGRQIARRSGAEVRVHGKDGRIRDFDTTGPQDDSH